MPPLHWLRIAIEPPSSLFSPHIRSKRTHSKHTRTHKLFQTFRIYDFWFCRIMVWGLFFSKSFECMFVCVCVYQQQSTHITHSPYFLSLLSPAHSPASCRTEWKYFLLFGCRIKDNNQDADEHLIDLLNLVVYVSYCFPDWWTFVLETTAIYAQPHNGILLFENLFISNKWKRLNWTYAFRM